MIELEAHPGLPRTRIDGIDVSTLDFGETLDQLEHWLTGSRSRRVVTANLDFLRLARVHDELRDTLKSCDLVTADGAPLIWLSRWTGATIPERVSGSDLVTPLIDRAARNGKSVYLLGGREGVAQRAAKTLEATIPALQIAGTSSPWIDWDDPISARRVAHEVRESGAGLLVVALGCPKQDLFLARHLHATGCQIGIGVGASLDFLVGDVQRAPMWMRRSGLEWAFRLLQEPSRMVGRYTSDAVHLARLMGRVVRLRLANAIAGSEVRAGWGVVARARTAIDRAPAPSMGPAGAGGA